MEVTRTIQLFASGGTAAGVLGYGGLFVIDALKLATSMCAVILLILL